MGKRDDTVLARDILEAIDRISHYTAGLTFQEFVHDNKCQDAVIRNLAIIGEAAKKLSVEFRQDDNRIPWPEIAGMRDRLIHDYFGTDLAIVWHTITNDLPLLKQQLNVSSREK